MTSRDEEHREAIQAHFGFVDPAREAQILKDIAVRRGQIAAARRNTTPGLADNFNRLAQIYPGSTEDLVTGAGLAGIPSEYSALRELAQKEEEQSAGVWDSIKDVGRGTLRGMFLAFDGLWEEGLSRPFRTAVAYLATDQGSEEERGGRDRLAYLYGKAGASTAAAALGDLASGERVNLGSGFLPQSTPAEDRPEYAQLRLTGVSEEQAAAQVAEQYGADITGEQQAKQRELEFRGEPISPGRVAASVVALEPGSIPYTVLSGAIDAAAQIAVDPAFFLGKTGTALRNVRRTVGHTDDTNLIQGFFRRTIGHDTAQWLDHADKGGRVIRATAEINQLPREERLVRLMSLWQPKNGEALPVAFWNDVMDAGTNEARIHGLVGQILGTHSTTTPFRSPLNRIAGRVTGGGEIGAIAGMGASFRVHGADRFPTLYRLMQEMPGRRINWTDWDRALLDVDDYMVSIGFDTTRRGHYLNEIVTRVADGDTVDGNRVLKEVFADFADDLEDAGQAPEVVKMLTDWTSKAEADRLYFLAKQGEMINPYSEFENGTQVLKARATLVTEMQTSAANLPDPRKIRRSMTKASLLFNNGMLEKRAIPMLWGKYMDNVWKPATLLRGAWTVRVVGEEQVRMAALGMTSGFSHPLQALDIARSDTNRLALDVLGEAFGSIHDPTEMMGRALTSRDMGLIGKKTTSVGDELWSAISKGEEDFHTWWAMELRQLGNDPLIQTIARAGGGDAGRAAGLEYLETPAGRSWMKRMAGRNKKLKRQFSDPNFRRAVVESSDARLQLKVGGKFDVYDTRRGPGATPIADSNGYLIDGIDESFMPNLNYQITQYGDAELIRAIGNGAFDDGMTARGFKNTSEFKQFAGRLGKLFDGSAPETVKGMVRSAEVDRHVWDDILNRAFETFMAKPTNWLSRSPAFRQFYWDKVTTLVPYMSDEALGELTAQLDDIGDEVLTRQLKKKFKRAVEQRQTSGLRQRLTDDAVARLRGIDDELAGIPVEGVVRDITSDELVSALAGKGSMHLDNFQTTPKWLRDLVGDVADDVPQGTFPRHHYLEQLEQGVKRGDISIEDLRRVAQGEDIALTTSAVDEASTVLRQQLLDDAEIFSESLNGLSMVDADDLAKASGLTETKRLLYDLERRKQWTDMMRNVFPFGEAWVEILTTWGRLLGERPVEILRRTQQGVEGAREAGFFTVNDQGEEVFTYPGGGLITKWMTGNDDAAGVALQAPVAGLNLFSQSVLPGFGPAVQIPASVFIPDTPNFDWLKDTILPFGEGEINTVAELLNPGKVIGDAMPPWFTKFITGLESPDGGPQFNRQYAATSIDIYKMMVLNGGDDGSPQKSADLLEKAKKTAGLFSFLRTAVQFVAPAAPTPVYHSKADPDGRFFTFQALADEYRNVVADTFDGDDYQATQWFIRHYGFDPMVLTVGKTTRVTPHALTAEAGRFESENGDLFNEFPYTAYYAQPDDPQDEFDYAQYLRQLDRGERVPRTPEQWLREVNSLKGNMQYEHARKTLNTDTEAGRARLRNLNIWLTEQYPGYGVPNVGMPETPSLEQRISEFENWADQPRLSSTSAGQGLQMYLQARRSAMGKARKAGITLEADDALPLREYLRNYAQWLVDQPQYQDFWPMFQSTFGPEIRELPENQTTFVGVP